ncbi:hypothetical protein PAXINDRAFT_99568 [Paxillus involutus ATCC 200175]|uniref:Uncharacterized protein n=1 Tax=Paxillus involutus ATCC 200175 TaxID=664439 RepID=A0A0C9U8F3_PAXIN|nr:hypothetical protein PAXINDRAFT_99568 [Paxillus involutus ATCC 200175]
MNQYIQAYQRSSLTTQHSQCVSHSSPSSALWLHTPPLSPFQALMRLPMVKRGCRVADTRCVDVRLFNVEG